MVGLFQEVHKFGGTSLADQNGFLRAAETVGSLEARALVIVSAMATVTDRLLEMTFQAANQSDDYQKMLGEVIRLHQDTAKDLFLPEEISPFLDSLQKDQSDISDILKGIFVAGQCSESVRELISGYGEIWSAQILSGCLRTMNKKSQWMNARQVLFVEHGETGPGVLWMQSLKAFSDTAGDFSDCEIVVVTGYVASLSNQQPTTLKRNGSDFSAAIFAKLSGANQVTIWTDVDGVMSADPRKVPQAFVVDELTYDEAMELAFFGAKVIHPKTMAPIIENEIPLFIRNSLRPELPGTRIGSATESVSNHQSPAKGFASIDKVALINLEGTGMLGVPGVAERLFRSMKEAEISVIMISQASSEHSICIVVPEDSGSAAVEEIKRSFFFELEHGHIQSVDLVTNCAVLAVVGDRMASTPGVSAKFFSSLANAGVNVRAIAQGSSERNISVVVDSQSTVRALRAVHSGFYLSKLTLSIGLVGPGLIGKTLLEQIAAQHEVLNQRGIDFKLRAVCNSKQMKLSSKALPFNHEWSEEDSSPLDISKFASHVNSIEFPHSVIVDCTASESVSDYYEQWLKSGIHIVTPNKKASSGDRNRYQKIERRLKENSSHFLYETTVGAGLPVIQTLKDLVATGDRIHSIEGVLSGTLSFIFNELAKGEQFSKVVTEAKALGFTEPDPREDLSGMDVARKVVILARESGLHVDLSDVAIENLVSEKLQEISDIEEFMQKLVEQDEEFNQKIAKAKDNGQTLLYVGQIDSSGKCRAGLKLYNSDHPFTRLQGTDNIILFETDRYKEMPLVVQGPGAGPGVTAAGVFSDLLRLSSFLGGKL